MTLADQFRQDVRNVFLHARDLSEPVLLLLAGMPQGTGRQVMALVQRGLVLTRSSDRGRTASWQMSVWVAKDDWPVLTINRDVVHVAPERGGQPQLYTPTVDLTPPHVPHMRRLGLVAIRERPQ